jgi:hypothetical protein
MALVVYHSAGKFSTISAVVGHRRTPVCLRGLAKDADTVRGYLAGFEAAGTDDVICFPASADVSQVDRPAEVAL